MNKIKIKITFNKLLKNELKRELKNRELKIYENQQFLFLKYKQWLNYSSAICANAPPKLNPKNQYLILLSIF